MNYKTLKFTIDTSCDLCKKGLKKLDKLTNLPKGTACVGRNIKTGKFIGAVKIVPDYNAFGNVTHYHIF